MRTNGTLIGVDLGGTNVRVGAITPARELLTFKDAPIEARQGPQAGIAKITDLIEAVLAEACE